MYRDCEQKERDLRIRLPKGCVRTKINTRDGWLSLKYKTRKDLHTQYSDWKTQEDFFPERPTKYNGCPTNQKAKLLPSVKIVFKTPMALANQKGIDAKVSDCTPDLPTKWTKSVWRVDILPRDFSYTQAENLAEQLK